MKEQGLSQKVTKTENMGLVARCSSLVARVKEEIQDPKILATRYEQRATNSENAPGNFFQQSLQNISNWTAS